MKKLVFQKQFQLRVIFIELNRYSLQECRIDNYSYEYSICDSIKLY